MLEYIIMSVSKKDLEEIKIAYEGNPRAVIEYLSQQLNHSNENIRISNSNVIEKEYVLEQIKKDISYLTRERNSLIEKKKKKELSDYENKKFETINKLVEGINEYRTQTSEQLKIHKHDLYVNTNLREKVDKMLDAIKEMKGGRRKSLKKKKFNKN